MIFWVYIISTDPGIYHSPPVIHRSITFKGSGLSCESQEGRVRSGPESPERIEFKAPGGLRQAGTVVGGSILSSLASPGRIGLWDSFLTWPFHGFSINGCWILNSYIQLGAHRPAVNYPVTPLKFNIAPEK